VNDDAKLDDATLGDGDLRAVARRLGQRPTARLDPDAVARGVLARLAAEPRARIAPWRHGRGLLRMAAAVLVLLGAAALVREWGRESAAPSLVSGDLAGLGERDLEGLLSSLGETLRAEPLDDDDLNDLTEDQLRLVLRSLEG
jgi:hypothetical protein